MRGGVSPAEARTCGANNSKGAHRLSRFSCGAVAQDHALWAVLPAATGGAPSCYPSTPTPAPPAALAVLQDLGVVDTVLSVAKHVPDSTLLTLHTDLVKSYPTQLITVRPAAATARSCCSPLLLRLLTHASMPLPHATLQSRCCWAAGAAAGMPCNRPQWLPARLRYLAARRAPALRLPTCPCWRCLPPCMLGRRPSIMCFTRDMGTGGSGGMVTRWSEAGWAGHGVAWSS